MDRIVGKFRFSILFLVFVSPCYAQLTLRALDNRGIPLKDTMVGRPFKLEVAVDGHKGRLPRPTIVGLDGACLRGRETSMQIINGASTVKDISIVAIDKPGVYTLGPAEIELEGVVQRSNTIVVTVNAASEGMPSPKDKKGQTTEPQLFAQLLVDKKQLVLGEKIRCTLQICSSDHDIRLQSMSGLDLSHFTIDSHNDTPVSSVKVVNGVTYNCFEWEWELYPTNPGQITIPAVQVNFNVPVALDEDDEDSVFNHFAPFLRRQYIPKRVYSNPLTITVQKLPDYNGTVQSIGVFERFIAYVKPATVHEGDAMVLTLEIQGSGDLKRIETPTLTGMPASLKWYDSKNYITEIGQTKKQKKCFEYIVQGVQSGAWEIPSQIFTYFDTTRGSYKKLVTKPINVTVLARAPKKTDQIMIEKTPKLESSVHEAEEIRGIDRDGVWYEQRDTLIPWWAFMLLVCAPLVGLVAWFLVRLALRYSGKYRGIVARKNAFAHARAALEGAERAGAYHQIYPIFIELFAVRFGIDRQKFSEDALTTLLHKKGFTDDQLKKWHDFFGGSAALVFAQQAKTNVHDSMFKHAYEWLILLEKKI